MRSTHRGENGQVLPGLLLAVVGSFAIAVSFFALPRLLDQTERADTAADAAVLGAARSHKEWFMLEGKAQVGNPVANFPYFVGLLVRGLGPTAYAEGEGFASSNGADLTSLSALPYDPYRQRWVISASTRQRDTIEGGNTTANSVRGARAEAKVVAGLCLGAGPGVDVNGTCKDSVAYVAECIPKTSDPPQPWCYLDYTAGMKWEIRLVE